MGTAIQKLKRRRAKFLEREKHSRAGGWFWRSVGLVFDALLVLALIPQSFVQSPTEVFQKIAQRAPSGEYLESYTKHLQYYRASVGCTVLTIALIAIKLASVILVGVFTLGEPRAAQAATISVSGTVYLTNESTLGTSGAGGFCDGATANLSLRVNGGAASTTTCSDTDATYSFSSITVNAGDTITLYSTDGAIVANRVYVSDATSDSGMDLYIDTVIIADEQDGNLTILDLLDYDNDQDATNMLFDADDLATDTLTVETNYELHIWGGDTFTPGGDVTVNTDLHVPSTSTLSIGSGFTTTLSRTSGTALTLSGTISGVGTLVYSSSTAFPTGGTMSSALRISVPSGGQTLPARTYGGNVEILNSSTGARTLTLGAGTHTYQGNFTVNASSSGNILVQGATNDPTLNITGDLDYIGTGSGSESVTAPNAAATWTISGNFDLTAGTWTTGSAETIVLNGTAKTYTSNGQTIFNLTLSGSITLADATHTIAGNLSMAGGTITAGTSTITMTGTANTITGGGATLANLTIDPASAGTITLQTSDLTVSSTLNIASGDTLSINVSRTLTHSGATLTLTGTISGAGRLTYQSSTAFPTGGTISSILRMDATSNDQTLSARTYGGLVEIYNNSGASARVITMAAGTHTFSGALNLLAANTFDITLAGATNNPTVNLTGDLDFTGSGSGTEVITSGTGTWTVSGNVDFTAGTYTATSANTLVMDGSSKTLTSNAQALQNLTLSGTITLANATHTIAGNLSMAGGTITAGTSTITVSGTSNTITGGGNTLNNLTIDPSSAGTITLQTSDLTVGGTLTVAASDTLSLNSGRTLTSGTGGTVTINGTISGAGTLTVQNSNLGTGGTLSAPLRLDATSGDLSLPARTFGGNVEVYSNASGAARTVTMAAGTHTVSGNLTINAANSQNVTLSGTNDPTLNLTGTLDFTGAGSGTERITSGAGTWTITGNVDFSDGTYTATAGNTLYLNGSGALQEITPKTHAGITFSMLRIGASESVAMWNSTATTFTIDSGGCLLSQDHAATDGRLHIYGACNSRANEYWSYATDFDGTSLGTPRQADVRFASGAAFTVDNGDALQVLGQSASANRTQITRQSSGNFSLTINGTINARYYDVDYTDASGLKINSGATVTNLADGSFDNIASGASAAYITVTDVASTATFTNLLFDSAGDGTDANAVYNVNADGPSIVWTISGATGNRAGESYDREVNGASATWVSTTVSVNDGTGADSDLTNVTTSLAANWSVSDPSGIASYSYAIGTTSGGTQVADFTSTGATTNVTRTGLSLTHGTTYYVTVRAFNSGSELVAAGVSDGLLIDAVAPTFSGVAASATTSSLTITWTSSEAASTKVKYGLSASYSSETTEDTNRVTSHTATISGLNNGTTYHYQVLGTDSAGNTGASAGQTVATSSLEATVITNTTATALSSTSVKITWTTNHLADSKVRYGKTTAFGLEKYDPTKVTSHEIILTDLEAGVTYSYEVLSVGNTSTNDATATFTPGASAPTPTILKPAENATFRMGEVIRVIGLAKSGQDVSIYVDGTIDGTTTAKETPTGTGSWAYRLTRRLSAGSHALQVTGSTNEGTSALGAARTITIAVPTISPTLRPALVGDGQELTVTIRGLVPSGATVGILVDGKEIARVTPPASSTGTSSFEKKLNVKDFPGGQHRVTVVAYNSAGKPSTPKDVVTFDGRGKILAPTGRQGIVDIVQPGDSLWSIAERVYGDGRHYPKLVAANKAKFPSLVSDPSRILPGWVLAIPK